MTQPAYSRADLPPALLRALDLAIDAKAAAPVVLRLNEVAGYTDWALIVSGRSDRHVGGISEAIQAGLKDMSLMPIGTDGLDEHLWDLLDYDDFLVHVFYHPVRKHYDLESMWRDAPRVPLALPEEVMDTSALEGLAPPEQMPPYRGGSFGAFPGELEGDEDELAGKPGELGPADDDLADADDDAGYDDEDDVEGEDGDADDAEAYGDDVDSDDYDYDDVDSDDADDDESDAAIAEAPDAPAVPDAPAAPARRRK